MCIQGVSNEVWLAECLGRRIQDGRYWWRKRENIEQTNRSKHHTRCMVKVHRFSTLKNQALDQGFFLLDPMYKQDILHQGLKISCTKVQKLKNEINVKWIFALKQLICFTAITFSLLIQSEISFLYLNDIVYTLKNKSLTEHL